jgi:hypothetical protein
MEKIKDLWAHKTPKYNVEYSLLFEKLANKGNGDRSEERIFEKGLIFSTQYEFYIYAFFIGLYAKERIELSSGKMNTDFGHNIENWGKKSKSDFLRKQFTPIQDFIFSSLVVYSDIDFIEIEKSSDEQPVSDAVNKLISTMEEFTNGGLQIIKEKIEDSPNYFYSSPSAAMNLILEYAKKINSIYSPVI